MKIKPSDADRFLARPAPDCAAILLYGPDDGLVRDRSRAVMARILGDPPDSLRLSDLSDADMKADPARLADEACAMALIPGDRLVRLRVNGEGSAKTIEAFLNGCADGTLKPDALVVIEGGDLGPRSTVRKLMEGAANGAAIACYADEGAALEALIERKLKEAGLALEPEARDALSLRLGADRGVTLQELEKLILFKGEDRSPVTLADVDACLPADQEGAVGVLADRVGQGDLEHIVSELNQSLNAGLAPVAILRGVSNHFMRLHHWLGTVAGGADPGDVIKRARPPIHFKRTAGIRRQLSAWSLGDVETALQALLEAERQCKTTGMPDVILTERILLSLARRAARQNRRAAPAGSRRR